ncbi:hypothetical protein A4X09_0g469 [Tilletia walkeri]|uniref:Uncharacterized protein n=1 Tax=Tilletia walkeri TaxID=117179 RepID=A0A8X7T7Q5_9BASI|nr:hypothetical protein A4X09_0g469 [Tilletia walkeri]
MALGPGPYLDAAIRKHQQLLPEAYQLRENGWSAAPVRNWGQQGYGPASQDTLRLVASKPLPQLYQPVLPIPVTVVLTFPVSEEHLNSDGPCLRHPTLATHHTGKK